MNRILVLLGPWIERRLVGGADAPRSPIPGAFLTLSASLFATSLVLPQLGLAALAALLCGAAFLWSGLAAFLEARELEDRAEDLRVLESLPVRDWEVGLARALVLAAALSLSTLNLALPPAVVALLVVGPAAAAGLVSGAAAAALAGLALALALRRALAQLLGVARLAELEGPVRLGAAVVLFAGVLAGADPTRWLGDHPGLSLLPPFSFVLFLEGRCAAGLAGVVLSLVLLAWAVGARTAVVARTGRRAKATSGSASWGWLVRADERAGFDFALANLRRDLSFRARAHPVFAFPFALVVLLALRPGDPDLALLALHGAVVYLVVARGLVQQSEDAGGPRLLETLPLADDPAFRVGQEKAFLVAVALPVYALLAAAVITESLLGRGPPPLPAAAHVVLACAFAVLVLLLPWRGLDRPFFSEPDRGVYRLDPGGSAMASLLLAVVGGLLAAAAACRPVAAAAVALGELGLARLALFYRRRPPAGRPEAPPPR